MAVTRQVTAVLFGADADKPTGKVGEIYFATDTKYIYICIVDAAWLTVTF